MPDRTKWEKDIKKKTDSWKEPVPEFIWEEIERDLPRPNLFKRNITAIRNIAAVLALTAIVISVFYVSRGIPEQERNIAGAVRQETGYGNTAGNDNGNMPATPMAERTTEQQKARQTYNNSRMVLAMAKAGKAVNAKAQVATYKGYTEDEEYTESNLINEKNTVNINNEENEREETGKRDYSPLKKEQPTQNYYKENKSDYTLKTKKAKRENSEWAVAVEAGNTYSNNGTAQSGISAREANMMLATNQISTYQSMFLKASIDQPETYTKHHFPVTGAITVRKYVSGRLSVETGLQYTMLRTDISTGGDVKLIKKQKLQYLGVPLRLSYDIVRINGFSMYASAGGALEGCISARNYNEFTRNGMTIREDTEEIELNRTQWSVNAAIGLQFNPLSFMGIYAEPGLTYFFDDGNDLSNIRQEHPLNFQLKAGVRFSF